MDEIARPNCERDHHDYRATWTPSVEELLDYERKPIRLRDSYPIMVKKMVPL